MRKIAYALAIAAVLIVATMGPTQSGLAQTSTPTATATVTATPTMIDGYSVDSFPRYSVNCFRLEATESISCLPGTPVPQ